MSTPAWAAATATPGKTIAWMSMSPADGKFANRPCATQVADAITTCPVRVSMAITDQVAESTVGNTVSSSRETSRRRACRVREKRAMITSVCGL